MYLMYLVIIVCRVVCFGVFFVANPDVRRHVGHLNNERRQRQFSTSLNFFSPPLSLYHFSELCIGILL